MHDFKIQVYALLNLKTIIKLQNHKTIIKLQNNILKLCYVSFHAGRRIHRAHYPSALQLHLQLPTPDVC